MTEYRVVKTLKGFVHYQKIAPGLWRPVSGFRNAVLVRKMQKQVRGPFRLPTRWLRILINL